jgi:GPI mannosyltransferase 3
MVDISGARRLAKSVSATGVRAKALAGHWPSERRLTAAGVALLILLAAGLRLIPTVLVPSLNWGDEIFQSTEQAHRLVYGYGLVPWEFQLGMRSWLLPGFVATLIEAARLIGDGPDVYLPVIAGVFGLFASAPAVCCFLWARRWYSLPAAFTGAALVAIAPELVYFGARVFTETVAAHLLVIACFLLRPADAAPSRRHLFAAGVLLGFVCLLRIHLAPAVLLVALWAYPSLWRGRVPALVMGGLLAAAFGAVLDWTTLGYPFASLWRNVLFNIVEGVSAGFGTEPWNYYFSGEAGLWGTAGLFMLLAAGLGARRLPLLLAAAIVIVAVHSGLAHKEYRFIYPAAVLVTVLAGLGIAQLTEWAAAWLMRQGIKQPIAAVICALLLAGYSGALMLRVWNGETMVELRLRVHDNLLAAAYVGHMPALCGLGMYGAEGRDWVMYGGYTHLHQPVPIYWPADGAELAAAAPAFDTLLLYAAPPPSELGFETIACFGKTCVAQRTGPCAVQPMSPTPFPEAIRSLESRSARLEALPADIARNKTP